MTLAGSSRSVVVIGGGLAGISAAIGLADAGADVTLLEARPWLGGATCSFGRRGLTIDNGQHVFMRCCVSYLDLLARLGVTAHSPLQDRLDLTVLAPTVLSQRGAARVRRSRLPAPLHLVRSIASYRLLSATERMKAAAAAIALQFVDADRDDRSLGDWLARHGQDEWCRRALWDPLSLSALNVEADRAGLPLAAAAISTALLAGRSSADLGVPMVPLSRLHGDPAGELLRQLKVAVRLGVRAVALRVSPQGGYDVRLAHAEPANTATGGREAAAAREPVYEHAPTELNAAGVVLAVPAWDAAALAPDELAADAARWTSLRPSPVVSIHITYGSRVTHLPFAAAVDSPVDWVVDKSAAAGLHSGQYLAASVRAADAWVDTSVADLRAVMLPALEGLFPAAAEDIVTDFFVTKERRATIAHVPGSGRARAAHASRLPGFGIAGAWTDTGWPDTMEGAVRSGRSAAQKVLAELPAAGSGAVTAVSRARRSEPALPAPTGHREMTSTS